MRACGTFINNVSLCYCYCQESTTSWCLMCLKSCYLLCQCKNISLAIAVPYKLTNEGYASLLDGSHSKFKLVCFLWLVKWSFKLEIFLRWFLYLKNSLKAICVELQIFGSHGSHIGIGMTFFLTLGKSLNDLSYL